MDFSKMTYAEFAGKLTKLSIKELYKMARGYGMSLPAGIESQETLLQAMHAHLSAPASTAGAESAPSSDAPVDAGSIFSVLSKTGKDYWRCNHKWTNRWQRLPLSQFSPAELKTLSQDPFLRTNGIPE